LELNHPLNTRVKSPINKKAGHGDISIPLAVGMMFFLLIGSMCLALFLNRNFLGVLSFYLVTTTLYSFYLKRIAVLDVLILAALYTVRIFAGSMACDIIVSSWLFMFSIFFFTSLAFVKRYTELLTADGNVSNQSLVGRGYYSGDIQLVSQFGVASAFTSVLVLVFYLFSKDVQELYRNPHYLSAFVPIIGYWIMRVWLLAHRGNMKDDPIEFALKDKTSLLLGVITIIIFATAVISF